MSKLHLVLAIFIMSTVSTMAGTIDNRLAELERIDSVIDELIIYQLTNPSDLKTAQLISDLSAAKQDIETDIPTYKAKKTSFHSRNDLINDILNSVGGGVGFIFGDSEGIGYGAELSIKSGDNIFGFDISRIEYDTLVDEESVQFGFSAGNILNETKNSVLVGSIGISFDNRTWFGYDIVDFKAFTGQLSYYEQVNEQTVLLFGAGFISTFDFNFDSDLNDWLSLYGYTASQVSAFEEELEDTALVARCGVFQHLDDSTHIGISFDTMEFDTHILSISIKSSF